MTPKNTTTKDLLRAYVVANNKLNHEFSGNIEEDTFNLIRRARKIAIDLGISNWKEEEVFSEWDMESAQEYADENDHFLFPEWMQTWKK